MDVPTTILTLLGGLALLLAAVAAAMSIRFHLGRGRADRVWSAARYDTLQDVGAVRRLSILPLIDSKTAQDDLAGEPGVAYLVRADDTTILFDVGLNRHGEHPSPLLRNMQALGVTLEEIDFFVFSHLHLDHVGGIKQQRQRTFALSGEPTSLAGKTALVPTPMTHPTAQVEVVEGPSVITPGVVSLGPIPRQLFFMGWTPEQSLAVNVDGKGIVLISGCGHSTLQRIISRAEMLFDEPIYGIVGGLHYPVSGSRRQRAVATGKWPWIPITREDVQTSIADLHRRRPRLVSLSPHDSCDWTLEAFREAFGESYQELLVGREIVID